jgi:hypothetical protein
MAAPSLGGLHLGRLDLRAKRCEESFQRFRERNPSRDDAFA